MRQKNLLFLVGIVLLVSVLINEYSYAMENPNMDRKVYIVIVNKLTLLDIESMPNIQGLIDDGNIGLMNTRGVGSHRGAESFATINSSAKTYANNESSQFHNLDGEYLRLYENRVGGLEGDYAIGNIGIGRLYNQNENNKYVPYLGALGDSLHSRGFKTAVFGNGDTEEVIDRTAALIAMDSKGLIDYGNLDHILLGDIDYPYGYRTDYDRILMEIEEIKEDSSLIVIETGDLTRLNKYSSFLSTEIFNAKRKFILGNIDKFIGDIRENMEKEKSLLMILSPNAEETRIDNSKLSPIILWGKDIEQGTITSSTTNREGIISNLDIGPTVASFLDSSYANMLGNSIESIERNKTLDYIKSINGRINTTSKIRSRALLFYAIISIAISIIISSIFWLNIRIDKDMVKLFRILLLLLYGTPLIFILNSLFINDSVFKFVLSSVAMVGIYGLLIIKYNDKKAMAFISSLIFIIIIFDLLFNGIITRFSIFSHDPTIGARYFGIGNELMGVFLAVATLVNGILFKKYNNRIIPVVFLILSTILIGHPRFGANVGGTISILIATIYFILEIMKKQLSFKNTILAIIITSIVIMAMGYIDIKLNPNPTHLGKSLKLLSEKGNIIAYNIIYRKLSMNLTLLRTSIWTKVLFASIFTQIAVMYREQDKLKNLINGKIGKGILSGVVGGVVGFLLNDSGIMLAAISMNLITMFILFFILEDEEIY